MEDGELDDLRRCLELATGRNRPARKPDAMKRAAKLRTLFSTRLYTTMAGTATRRLRVDWPGRVRSTVYSYERGSETQRLPTLAGSVAICTMPSRMRTASLISGL